ncbi:hypothetical protein GCM10023185_03260 [Hymenobacter saemangeumensis]|uniref:Outer membrane protein beta-barrel domain-containing protein n=1 Tax=Hymenobacter saemangeumensis TaxID=1084522 RepID=A0ABP8HZ16_9BACT
MKSAAYLLALLGTAATATAQTTDVPATAPAAEAPATAAKASSQRVAFGLKAGATYSSFRGSDATAYRAQYKPGFLGGLTATLDLGETVSLHPEVLYVRKGSNFEADVRNRDLSYLDVPLLVRYSPMGSFGAKGAFLEAGPQASLLLSAKNKAGDDVKSEFNTLTYGFVFGAGYQLASGLSLGLRYEVGIADAYQPLPRNVSQGRGEYQQNAKNDVFSLLLGYSFSL